MAPDQRIQLRREAEVAAATVRAAYRNDHGPATRATESVIRGQKESRNSLAERRATFFERAGEPVDQRFSPGELIIDRSEVCQGANSPIHCSSVPVHRCAVLASGSSLRSAAATAWKMAAALGASRMAFTASSYANIWESLCSHGR